MAKAKKEPRKRLKIIHFIWKRKEIMCKMCENASDKMNQMTFVSYFISLLLFKKIKIQIKWMSKNVPLPFCNVIDHKKESEKKKL